nr:MerR family transcriptional regulator [Novosphingobium hassiacum]
MRTIGEVTSALGIKQHVLRYWEEQFPTLRPLTRAGGRRYYRPEDIALIMRINRLLHHEGYTIKGAKQALSGKYGGSRGGTGEKSGRPTGDPGETARVAAGSVAGGEPDAASSNPLAEILASIRERLAAAIED